MEIPFSRWYVVISKRRSRRYFDQTRPIEPELLAALSSVCTNFRPFSHARAELVTGSAANVFKGAIGHYGKINGAPAFIAFIGDMDSPSVQEEVGYMGEGIILEATALQLNTCWVGGFFKPEVAAKLVGVSKNEKVLAVTPVGYAKEAESAGEKLMTSFERSHWRQPLRKLVTGIEIVKWPEWVRLSLEAARLAPSAVNRQPWGFHVEDSCITVFVRTSGPDFGISKRLDCGIVMLHIEVAALNCGMKGKWELLQSPQVAKFKV